MTTKHTPAPWDVLHSKTFNKVSSFDVKQNDISEAEWNKKLITAAPDLLDALIDLFTVTNVNNENIDALDKARTAITKATGSINDES
jgi:hypothetical protein